MRSPSLFKKAAAIAVVTPVAFAGLAVMTASPAAAHQGNIKVTSAKCVDRDTMEATFEVGWSSVPQAARNTIIGSRTGTQTFNGAWDDSPAAATAWANVNRGAVGSESGTRTWTVTLEKSQFGGTNSANGPWEYAHFPWTNGNTGSRYHDTRVENFDWNTCTSKVPVPAKPTPQDPCGPGNASWVVPADTESLDWTLESDGDLVVTTKVGYVFTDGSTSRNFGKAPDSGTKCTIPVPAKPSQSDPCGPNNAAWNVPADTATIDWTLLPNGDLTATALQGNEFENGQTVINFGKAKDSNEPCVVPVPAQPTNQDPCGPNNSSWNVPANTATVVWTLESDGDLVAATTPGNVFQNGQTQINFGKAPDSGTLCVVPLPPAPTSVDKCGPGNASWNVPVDSESYDWTLLPNGHLTVAVLGGNTFPDGSTVKDYGVAPDSNEPCPYVCPPGTTWTDSDGDGVVDQGECNKPKKVRGAAKMVDKCRTAGDMFAVRKDKGVVYFADGQRIREGVWLKTGGDRKIVVKAKAASKKFDLVGKSRWVFRFDNRSCGNPEEPPNTGARFMA